MRAFVLAAGLLISGWGVCTVVPVRAAEAIPFTTAKELNLITLLPPPPANDAAQTKQELGEVLLLQVTRTPEMEAQAAADATENVWRYANVMGPKFAPDNLPKFKAFFDRVVQTEEAVVDPAKDHWKRIRPHKLSELVKPAVKISNSGAWPSGHATVGTLMGIVLANMVPEKRAEIMARAWDYGNNRVVGGIHFRSDVEMGRISGSIIAARIMQQDEFKAEFEGAKAELRKELGL